MMLTMTNAYPDGDPLSPKVVAPKKEGFESTAKSLKKLVRGVCNPNRTGADDTDDEDDFVYDLHLGQEGPSSPISNIPKNVAAMTVTPPPAPPEIPGNNSPTPSEEGREGTPRRVLFPKYSDGKAIEKESPESEVTAKIENKVEEFPVENQTPSSQTMSTQEKPPKEASWSRRFLLIGGIISLVLGYLVHNFSTPLGGKSINEKIRSFQATITNKVVVSGSDTADAAQTLSDPPEAEPSGGTEESSTEMSWLDPVYIQDTVSNLLLDLGDKQNQILEKMYEYQESIHKATSTTTNQLFDITKYYSDLETIQSLTVALESFLKDTIGEENIAIIDEKWMEILDGLTEYYNESSLKEYLHFESTSLVDEDEIASQSESPLEGNGDDSDLISDTERSSEESEPTQESQEELQETYDSTYSESLEENDSSSDAAEIIDKNHDEAEIGAEKGASAGGEELEHFDTDEDQEVLASDENIEELSTGVEEDQYDCEEGELEGTDGNKLEISEDVQDTGYNESFVDEEITEDELDDPNLASYEESLGVEGGEPDSEEQRSEDQIEDEATDEDPEIIDNQSSAGGKDKGDIHIEEDQADADAIGEDETVSDQSSEYSIDDESLVEGEAEEEIVEDAEGLEPDEDEETLSLVEYSEEKTDEVSESDIETTDEMSVEEPSEDGDLYDGEDGIAEDIDETPSSDEGPTTDEDEELDVEMKDEISFDEPSEDGDQNDSEEDIAEVIDETPSSDEGTATDMPTKDKEEELDPDDGEKALALGDDLEEIIDDESALVETNEEEEEGKEDMVEAEEMQSETEIDEMEANEISNDEPQEDMAQEGLGSGNEDVDLEPITDDETLSIEESPEIASQDEGLMEEAIAEDDMDETGEDDGTSDVEVEATKNLDNPQDEDFTTESIGTTQPDIPEMIRKIREITMREGPSPPLPPPPSDISEMIKGINDMLREANIPRVTNHHEEVDSPELKARKKWNTPSGWLARKQRS